MKDDLLREVHPGERTTAAWANRLVKAVKRRLTDSRMNASGGTTALRR